EDVEILRSSVVIQDNKMIVEFSIEKAEGLSDLLFKQLEFQTQRVNLNNRLKREINLYLSSLAISLIDSYGDNKNVEGVQRFLTRSFNNNKIKFGLNDWRTALLKSLATCSEFCDGGFISILGIEHLVE